MNTVLHDLHLDIPKVCKEIEVLIRETMNNLNRDGAVVGVSGGTDSSYLLMKAVEWGLRPLAVHYAAIGLLAERLDHANGYFCHHKLLVSILAIALFRWLHQSATSRWLYRNWPTCHGQEISYMPDYSALSLSRIDYHVFARLTKSTAKPSSSSILTPDS